MATIYKILRAEEWDELEKLGQTNGAAIDLSDGYVHFSTAQTVRETAEKYFAGEGDLKLLAYDDQSLGDALVYEPARGGVLFPHLYGPLVLADAIWVKDLPLIDGTHQFPGEL